MDGFAVTRPYFCQAAFPSVETGGGIRERPVFRSTAKRISFLKEFVGSYPVPSMVSLVTFVIFKSSQQTRGLRQTSPLLPYAASPVKSQKTRSSCSGNRRKSMTGHARTSCHSSGDSALTRYPPPFEITHTVFGSGVLMTPVREPKPNAKTPTQVLPLLAFTFSHSPLCSGRSFGGGK